MSKWDYSNKEAPEQVRETLTDIVLKNRYYLHLVGNRIYSLLTKPVGGIPCAITLNPQYQLSHAPLTPLRTSLKAHSLRGWAI